MRDSSVIDLSGAGIRPRTRVPKPYGGTRARPAPGSERSLSNRTRGRTTGSDALRASAALKRSSPSVRSRTVTRSDILERYRGSAPAAGASGRSLGKSGSAKPRGNKLGGARPSPVDAPSKARASDARKSGPRASAPGKTGTVSRGKAAQASSDRGGGAVEPRDVSSRGAGGARDEQRLKQERRRLGASLAAADGSLRAVDPTSPRGVVNTGGGAAPLGAPITTYPGYSDPYYYYNNNYWGYWGGYGWCWWWSWPGYCSGLWWSSWWWNGCGYYSGWRSYPRYYYYGPYLPYSRTVIYTVYQDEPYEEVVYVEGEAAPEGEAVVPAAPLQEPAEQQPGLNRASDYYLTLGDRAFRDGRFGDAVHYYAKAVEFAPDEGILYLILADALFATGDYHYAAYALKQALKLDPGLATNVVDKHSFYPDGETFDRQLAVLERYVEDHFLDDDARLVLAANYLFGAQPAKAIEVLESPFSADVKSSPAGALILDSSQALEFERQLEDR